MSEEIQVEQKESIKLTKNTKGFNWEIKLLASGNELTVLDIERLDNLNKELEGKYGTRE